MVVIEGNRLMAANDAISAPRVSIPVDPEHGALRLIMVFIFVFLLVASYIVINLVLPADGVNLIAVLGSLVLTFVLSQQVENQLKERWPSGRQVIVDDANIRIYAKDKLQVDIDGQQQVNVHMWRFKISRRSRVPKGWFVVACALEQESVYLPAYTFMSPEQFGKLPNASQFPILMSKADMDRKSDDRDLRLAGQQRRLHTAEQARWMNGAEMSATDFEQYLVKLQTLYPKWMPTN